MRSITKDDAKVVMLNILKDFHQYCVKEGLCYSLDSGTLLGAVRHKGYIPWDDDVDVIMPRADYERFFASFGASGAFPHLRLRDYRTEPGYSLAFMKLEDTRTKIGALGKEALDMGLHIDIFPVDGMPKSIWASALFMRTQRMLRHAATLAGLHLNVKGRSFLKQLFLFSFKLCTLWTPSSVWNRLLNGRASRYVWSDSRWAKCVVWFDNPKIRVPARVFEGRQVVEFEKEEFYAVGDIHGYLTCLYGDYMTPPPPEMRTRLHLDDSRIYADESLDI